MSTWQRLREHIEAFETSDKEERLTLNMLAIGVLGALEGKLGDTGAYSAIASLASLLRRSSVHRGEEWAKPLRQLALLALDGTPARGRCLPSRTSSAPSSIAP